eukprot:SAG31_NODE_1116_length_9830_cov_11.188470_3_plen_122_part_00
MGSKGGREEGGGGGGGGGVPTSPAPAQPESRGSTLRSVLGRRLLSTTLHFGHAGHPGRTHVSYRTPRPQAVRPVAGGSILNLDTAVVGGTPTNDLDLNIAGLNLELSADRTTKFDSTRGYV